MKNILYYFCFIFVLFFSVFYSVNVVFAGTAVCITGQYCDPTWSNLECQSGSEYTCDCGAQEATCESAGSWECTHAYNRSSISCDGGSSCKCSNPIVEPTPPPPSYPTPEPTPPPTYNTYNSYQTYPTYQDYPSYPTYNSYESYPTYNNYPSYPSYPSYNSYNTYPSYNSYNTYTNTYPTYNTYPPTFSLTVTKAGGGVLKSVDGFINCGVTCSKNDYVQGTSVTLKATPASSYWKFNGWSGDCSGTGDCVLNINASKSVTGSFVPRAFIYKEF